MTYIPAEDWRKDPNGANKRWEEGMDLLGRFINVAMFPNAFAFDSGFVDKYMHHILNAMILQRLWRMDTAGTKPVVLSTGLPCDTPHENYRTSPNAGKPWFEAKKQEGYTVCYEG